jgi:hypothetical protein
VPGAVPKHFRPYAIPVIYLEAFKKELIHLVKIGVLSPQGSENILHGYLYGGDLLFVILKARLVFTPVLPGFTIFLLLLSLVFTLW